MKNKGFFGLFLATCIIFSLCIFKVFAAQRQPSFFIPQKVLDNMYKKETLPPIETITVNGKPNPVVLQQRQKARAEALKKRQAEKIQQQRLKEQTHSQQPTQTEQKKHEELAKNPASSQQIESFSPEKQNFKPEPQEPEMPPIETFEKSNTQTNTTDEFALEKSKPIPAPSAIQSQNIQAPIPSDTSPDIIETISSSDEKNSFDAIIADYKRDAEGIGKGDPVNNPRLRDVLKDYTDDWHIL